MWILLSPLFYQIIHYFTYIGLSCKRKQSKNFHFHFLLKMCLKCGPLRLLNKLYNAWKLILVVYVTGGLSLCGDVQGAVFQLVDSLL